MVGFEIHYRPGKQNVVADALSRKAQDVQLQKALKELNRSQILIPATQFAGARRRAAIAAGAAGGDDPTIAIYTPGSARQAETPNSRDGEQAEIPDSRFQVQSGLLCYDGRLVVPDEANLRTALCHEAHRPRSQAHPGRNKMRKILTRRSRAAVYFELWNELCRLVGTKMKLSTAEHPQTDGQTEIINQFLQTKLRPYLDYYQDNWSEMPCLDFAHSTHPHESIGLAPAELEMGYLPRMSEQLGRTAAQQFASRAAEGSGGEVDWE
ncbi:hypothetical protein HRG_009777 [Hirsutella rhossiliensis]|uniref:Integrase catalytic domain-containing protein n=1 Tax=Hirsutella rhossiliensis TaxID=111463 RepID=A0A9P8SFS8_9HYPO|nr:uncharacterized protein HRG_09777 [Hirsutella rhossiliensis]KAH0959316.1 hypothetical protein HRG_09777 [Hirsutella rhossiliensis]